MERTQTDNRQQISNQQGGGKSLPHVYGPSEHILSVTGFQHQTDRHFTTTMRSTTAKHNSSSYDYMERGMKEEKKTKAKAGGKGKGEGW